MKKLLAIILIAAAVLIIIYVALRKEEHKETIKIGALLMLSGEGASWGENAKRGIDLALREMNGNGGIGGRKIELIIEDTGGEAERAVLAYKKLVNVDKVNAIIGPLLETEMAAISQLASQDQMPVVAPAYAPFQNRPQPYNPLMISMDPTREAERMADYVYGNGIRSISVIGTTDSWEREVSEAFANKFSSLGGRIVFKELLQKDASDIRTEVAKAISLKPDAIFIGTYYQYVHTVKALQDYAYHGKLYSIEVDTYLAHETKGYADGLQFIAPGFYSENFIRIFNEKYKINPGIPAGQSYDSMHILLSLLSQNKTKGDIIAAMERFRNYEGASGTITITDDYRTLMPTAIFELQNGEIVKVK